MVIMPATISDVISENAPMKPITAPIKRIIQNTARIFFGESFLIVIASLQILI